MPVRIHLSLYGSYHEPFSVTIDNEVLRDIRGGEKLLFEIPPGKHDLSLHKEPSSAAKKFSIDAADGDTVKISAYSDVDTGEPILIDESNPAFSDLVNGLKTKDREARLLAERHSAKIGNAPQKLKVAYGCVLFIGCYTVVFGLFVFFIDYFRNLGFSAPYMIIFGVVFLALSFMVKKKTNIALIIAVICYSWDTISLFLAMTRGFYLGAGGLTIHGVLLVFMIRGIGAIRVLKKNEAEAKRVAS